MKYRDEQEVKADDRSTSVDLEYNNGRFLANVFYDRTMKNGDVQPVHLVLPGLTASELRCIARSLHEVLNRWSEDWHETKNTLKGKDE